MDDYQRPDWHNDYYLDAVRIGMSELQLGNH